MRDNTENRFWLVILLFYGIPNIVLYLFTIQTGILVVDMIPISFSLELFESIACLLLLFASLFFVIYISKYGSNNLKFKSRSNQFKFVGVAIFVLQAVFLWVVFNYDHGRVGAAGESKNILAILFSYIGIDSIFIIYYAHSRPRKIPFINLTLYIISNTLRGWTGIWLILAMIEGYFALQKMPFNRFIRKSLIYLTVGIIAYPAINQYKEFARGADLARNENYVESISRLVVRLQLITSTMLVAQEKEVIEKSISDGTIRSYYSDNKLAAIFVPLNESEISLQKYLTRNYLIDFSVLGRDIDEDKIGWYTHTGLTGWLFGLRWYALPIYLLFIYIITIAPYMISARFIGSSTVIPALHVASLLYVFHGWFSVQISFIFGLIFYVMICRMGLSLQSQRIAGRS